ncbi:GNAT family N-acetyltransferase [Candidatus Woesearchaeota archaeon]|nr:GNAT family N-acetyltransferase [Candidatus Woesearchaeota archaeon]MBW3017694.1 GNAT family N-acetyltransferase [Candidatus Woesearchaeota archaeon]
MIIKAKGFILRPHKLSDAQNIYKYQQDKDVKKNFMTFPKSVAEVKKEIKENKKKSKFIKESFVIDVDGEAIGEVTFSQRDPHHKKKVKMSIWVAKKCRGKGIATKVLKLVTNYAFKKYKLVRIEASVRTFNKASARAAEKAGFKLEGILRKNKYKNGKYVDDMLFAIVK